MNETTAISCLFVDIGGVLLLTDGWNHHIRERTAAAFKLDWDELEERHHLNFNLYEVAAPVRACKSHCWA
ncbi:MAG: hypothetical protein NTY50_02365 [Methylobacter sp.]|nr:hypothetical protein [Methylobacter sp.]